MQSLSGMLASPVSDDDYAERGRRMELWRFVLVWISISLLIPLRKLEGIIMKLQPLIEQHVLVGFLHNVDNAKTLTGFVRELADAITDYQV